MKLCPSDPDFLLRSAPDLPGYFEPVLKGTRKSALPPPLFRARDVARDDIRRDNFISNAEVTTSFDEYDVTVNRIYLPGGILLEEEISSWCIYQQCEISPRTYFYPVTSHFSLLGLTDSNGQGHVIFLNMTSFELYSHVTPKVKGRPAKIGGVVGFHDMKFAVLLFVENDDVTAGEMYLQMYRSDLSLEWQTRLNSAISSPTRDVGDFRLSYGSGYYAAYFSVFGTDNFANGTNGEQLSFVDDRGKLKSTSFKIPGQNFVTSGDAWGCSHSLAQLVDYHDREEEFITICAADLFPRGISIGDSLDGTLLFKSDGDGLGFSSAILGQLAQAEIGWKLVFSAQNSECCEGRGIGLITIYNEEDKISGKQAFDPVTWLTETDGRYERDAVIGRFYTRGTIDVTEETFLIGWRVKPANELQPEDEYRLGIIDTFGSFIKKPFNLSSIEVETSDFSCIGSSCLGWGNRDNSFQTLKNGNVGWIKADPKSNFIHIVRVGVDKSGWSLWSSWSQCSLSCGGGTTTRVRSCLTNEDCDVREESETEECNTQLCQVPIKCSFVLHPGVQMSGDLFVNGQRQFAFSRTEGEEKCAMFRDLCAGITRTRSRDFYFYFLKTSTNKSEDNDSTSFTMTCKENPGWSEWELWSSCSTSCGGGVRRRKRFCDGDLPGSDVCIGRIDEEERCETGRCPSWSSWLPWSECSATCDRGNQTRSRSCVGDYPNACFTLVGVADEVRECSLGRCSSWDEWGAWSDCSSSCGEGFQERIRECSGDFPCPETEIGDTDTRSCDLGVCPYWSEWGPWSPCGASCGESERFRSRDCLGKLPVDERCPLDGVSYQNEGCNLGDCNYLGEWSKWGSCSKSCGSGRRERRRECLGDFDQFSCPPGVLTQQEECFLGVCPKWELWGPWSECSASCGIGVTSRSRSCQGSFPCPKNEPSKTNATCNLGECPSWGTWGAWGACTITCGSGGVRSRTRECLGDFPDLCEAQGHRGYEPCTSLPPCPRWSSWSQWSDCSKTCDRGFTTRRRTCQADDVDTCGDVTGGKIFRHPLGYFDNVEEKSCNFGNCSYWLDWVSWGQCSATCGEGSRVRQRDCYGDFPNMCLSLGSPVDTEKCSRGRCGAWSEWSPWGGCSATCGSGFWQRSRDCPGNFNETCVGETSQTTDCDVADCVDECTPNPCNNGGACRRNIHLARLYHCLCDVGWMGKHCDYRGPEVTCGSDSIIVSLARKIVDDENLLSHDSRFVGFTSRKSLSCTSFMDHVNGSDRFILIMPSPIDVSCGSVFQANPSEYRVRNRVTWQAEDNNIRSTVILLDFTCVYQRKIFASSSLTSSGPVAIESYKREIKMVTSNGIFEVKITLFRDVNFQRPISPSNGTSSLVTSLSEGETVFVSVDLMSRDLLTSRDALLVMDNCFVTSSATTKEPLTYLIKKSCPVSPFVTVISNGQSTHGRFSVRVFGWTGSDVIAKGVFIHCTVNICNRDKQECKPDCESSIRHKRFIRKTAKNRFTSTINQIPETSSTESAVNRNGRPYTKIVKTIAPLADGRAAVNLSATNSDVNFDPNSMVSAGPFLVLLETGFMQMRSSKLDLAVVASDTKWTTKPIELLAATLSGCFVVSLVCVFIILWKKLKLPQKKLRHDFCTTIYSVTSKRPTQRR